MTKRKTPTNREAFEKWASKYGWTDLAREPNHYDMYASSWVDGAWVGWQAALRYAKRRKEKWSD